MGEQCHYYLYLKPDVNKSQNLTAFGIAVDVGSVTTMTQPMAYVIGVVRDPVIQYFDGQTLSPYYRSKYTTTQELASHLVLHNFRFADGLLKWSWIMQISDVLNNFTDVIATSGSIDEQILSVASTISANYSGLLAISTRQIFGALDYTILSSEVDENDIKHTDVRVFARDFGILGSGGFVLLSHVFFSFANTCRPVVSTRSMFSMQLCLPTCIFGLVYLRTCFARYLSS